MAEPRTELHWRVERIEEAGKQRDAMLNQLADKQGEMDDKLDRVLDKLVGIDAMARAADARSLKVSDNLSETERRKKWKAEEAASDKERWADRRNLIVSGIGLIGLIYATLTGTASAGIEQLKAFLIGVPK